MSKPVIFAVDEDPQVFEALERELHRRYDHDYEVRVERSGPEALSALTWLSDSGQSVAIVMWGDCGYDIEETRRPRARAAAAPAAKRVLLVPWRAWADERLSGVILRSMARGRIDYYVLKPVRCPDELFHERVSNFLYEWARSRNMASYAVRVVGQPWSRRSHEIRDLLQRNGLPNAYCTPDSPEGRELRGPRGATGACRSSRSPTIGCSWTRRTSRWPRRSASACTRATTSSTSSWSGAGRRACPPASTARRRACARWWSRTTRSAARRARAR